MPDADETLPDTDACSIDHLEAKWGDAKAEVYFFKRWATYQHPVTPVDPLYFEQAVQRKAYNRAWMQMLDNDHRFVFFETVENVRRPSNIVAPRPGAGELFKFYGAAPEKGGFSLREELNIQDLILWTNILAVSEEPSTPSVILSTTVLISYRYDYYANGALKRATVTNPAGKISVLDY